MTLLEAVNEVRAIYPDRSVSADKIVFYHKPPSDITTENYRLSILPGLRGSDCQQFNGESPEHCLQLLLAQTAPFAAANLE